MRWIFGCFLALTIFAQSNSAFAVKSIVEYVVQSCKTEITNYCSKVTPGEGRLLACFYAHEDKLTVGCINALYEGMSALERKVEALSQVASQCRQDIKTYCSKKVPGQGRIAKCLLSKKAKLSDHCVRAIDETGLHMRK